MLMVILMVIPTRIIGVHLLNLKSCLKDFINLNKLLLINTVEEKFGKIDVLASKVDSLALDVDLLKLKVMPMMLKKAKH